jgi:hypothetical protein
MRLACRAAACAANLSAFPAFEAGAGAGAAAAVEGAATGALGGDAAVIRNGSRQQRAIAVAGRL